MHRDGDGDELIRSCSTPPVEVREPRPVRGSCVQGDSHPGVWVSCLACPWGGPWPASASRCPPINTPGALRRSPSPWRWDSGWGLATPKDTPRLNQGCRVYDLNPESRVPRVRGDSRISGRRLLRSRGAVAVGSPRRTTFKSADSHLKRALGRPGSEMGQDQR